MLRDCIVISDSHVCLSTKSTMYRLSPLHKAMTLLRERIRSGMTMKVCCSRCHAPETRMFPSALCNMQVCSFFCSLQIPMTCHPGFMRLARGTHQGCHYISDYVERAMKCNGIPGGCHGLTSLYLPLYYERAASERLHVSCR